MIRTVLATLVASALLLATVGPAHAEPSVAAAPIGGSMPATAAAPTASSAVLTLAARRGWCDGGQCKTWRLPYYSHGIIPIKKWNRCVRWEFHGQLNYRVAERVTGSGSRSHMVEGLWLNRSRVRMRVRRYCDPEHDSTRRALGGVHVRPSVHMTGHGSGSCSLTPSVGVSFPWSVSVGVSPSCDKAKIASRDSSMVSSRRSTDYRFAEAEPRKRQLRYRRYTTMLDPADYAFVEYHAVCFRVGLSGSVEHPKRSSALSFAKSRVRCVNLLDGSA